VLEGGKPRSFAALLGEMGLGHNSLLHHLERLTNQGFVAKDKAASNRFGRPRFAYRVPSRTVRHITVALEDEHCSPWPAVQPPETHLKVREEGLLQRNKEEPYASNLPQNPKIRLMTTLHHFRDKPARFNS
jgi:hypothetical protein